MDVGLIIFGENPEVLDPVAIQLKNHEVARPTVNNYGVVESYAANTN